MIDVKDCKSVWNNCLEYIRQCVGDQSFKTWFEPVEPLMLVNNVLTIQVPSQFFYEWLEEHYVHVLRKAIDEQLGSEGRLEYQIFCFKFVKSTYLIREKRSKNSRKRINEIQISSVHTQIHQLQLTQAKNIFRLFPQFDLMIRLFI